ncbi:MAG: methylmalonyl Co-A mutase-associated GTPase MeaB [Deltaproteobacteria bacterium]|nr:methylmalonyl Co-A mutase-associated GTPase MeaB [Deltaproteobacteria bacterium]
MAPPRPELSTESLVAGVLSGDRAILGRAITLLESTHPSHRCQAQEVLLALMPHTGNAQRVGVSGVPGVGKSTFIEAFGRHLIECGHRVAVLTIDPSSTVTGGSVLGDKTRMAKLSQDARAFIRPSPSGGTLGGVASRTREVMLACEAAGFDVVLVESVGVGQSEATLADLVDFFLLLMLPSAGDELQGIKRGILEVVDMVAVNKADGALLTAAQRARQDYDTALHILRGHDTPPVKLISAATGHGIPELWTSIDGIFSKRAERREIESRRRGQAQKWMWALIDERLLSHFRSHPEVVATRNAVEDALNNRALTPQIAAEKLLTVYGLDVLG